VLVNARSSERVEQRQAIAQASLAGGGEAESGRATVAPAAVRPHVLRRRRRTTSRRRSTRCRRQQMLMLANLKRTLAAMPPARPKQAADNPGGPRPRRRKRRHLVKLLAEIEKRINEENSRPKKRYISPSTREEVYAGLLRLPAAPHRGRGTSNFPGSGGPQAVRRAHHDRHRQPRRPRARHRGGGNSGNRTLDRRAPAIARAAGPFGRFNEPMRRKADQIVVVSRFKFTRDDTLETKLTSR
jgi:protein TonB